MSEKLRKIRRSQLITPFGVGAIVPFPGDESLIIGGLDKWDCEEDHYLIDDERLAKRVGVSALRCPPDFAPASNSYNAENSFTNKSIPAYRFPTLCYCAHCGRMDLIEPDNIDTTPVCHFCCDGTDNFSSAKQAPFRLLPERFVVVCPNGHLQNFPIAEYLASKGADIDPDQWNNIHLNYRYTHPIIRKNLPRTTSLSGIIYEYSSGSKSVTVSMSGMTQAGALASVLKKCSGSKPWLGNYHDDECPCSSSQLLVVQRGGSNVWFPEIVTSIYLPKNSSSDFDPKIVSYLQKNKEQVGILQQEYQTTKTIPVDMMNAIANYNHVDPSEFRKCCEEMVFNQKDDSSTEQSEAEYRFDEYKNLCRSCGSDEDPLLVKNFPITSYDKTIQPFFHSISLVEKMKETQALIGFSRLTPRQNLPPSEFEKDLSIEKKSWVPAVQTQGEGVFIRFNEERIKKWASNPKVISRAGMIKKSLASSCFSSKYNTFDISPEFLLVHTFAHVLINSFSKICGYGSSSLRERLYVSTSEETAMFGILIYTTSGSSEGSLGGLIKQGSPNHIEDLINSAIEEARWCSSDPVCIQSKGQGPDSCNLAACYNCALLPETCCETGNRFLDRACLIGLVDDPTIGYFNVF